MKNKGIRLCGPRKLSSQGGVTLVELVMVLVIIFITSAAAVSLGVDYMPIYRLRSGAWQVLSHLRMAQFRATSMSVEYRLNFTSANDYQIERGNRFTNSDTWVAEDPDNPSRLVVPRLTLPKNITFNPTPAAVVFRTNGTNRGDNTITINLSNEKGRRQNLTISPAGRVKIED